MLWGMTNKAPAPGMLEQVDTYLTLVGMHIRRSVCREPFVCHGSEPILEAGQRTTLFCTMCCGSRTLCPACKDLLKFSVYKGRYVLSPGLRFGCLMIPVGGCGLLKITLIFLCKCQHCAYF